MSSITSRPSAPSARRRCVGAVSAVVAGALLLAACGGGSDTTNASSDTTADAASSGGELSSFRGVNGDPTNGPSGAVMGAVQIAEGWDEEEGLDLQWDVAQSAAAGLQLLGSGGVEISQSSTPNAYAAAHLDPKMRIVGFLNGPNYVVTVPEDSDIKGAEDLAGKTVGVMTLGSASHLMVQGAVEAAGLKPEDVNYLPVPVGAPMAQALNSGGIDALVGWEGMWQSISALTDTPLKRLPTKLSELYGHMVMVSTTDVIEERREDLVAYMRNMYKSCALGAEDPVRAVEDHWEVFPNVAPPAAEREQTLKDMAEWNVDFYKTCAEPSPDTGKVGSLSDKEVEETYQFFLDNGIIENEVDFKSVVDTSITEEALEGIDLEEFVAGLS